MKSLKIHEAGAETNCFFVIVLCIDGDRRWFVGVSSCLARSYVFMAVCVGCMLAKKSVEGLHNCYGLSILPGCKIILT